MNNMLKVTGFPRKAAGESSEMYSGTTRLAPPTGHGKANDASPHHHARHRGDDKSAARGLAIRALRLVQEVIRLFVQICQGMPQISANGNEG